MPASKLQKQMCMEMHLRELSKKLPNKSHKRQKKRLKVVKKMVKI